MMERAVFSAADADIFMVIGTSMQVYPAAGLINYVPEETPVLFIDPNIPEGLKGRNLITIPKKATEGVPEVVAESLKAEE
jgi:NAD-dependent deacetylase